MLRALQKSREMISLMSRNPDVEGINPKRLAAFNEGSYFLRLFAAYTAETEGNRRIDVRFMRGLIRVLALVNFVIADDYGKEVKQLKRAMKKARAPIGEGKR